MKRRDFVGKALQLGLGTAITNVSESFGAFPDPAPEGVPRAPGVEPASDWPVYRHDPALTATSPLKGGLDRAPALAWSVDVGGRPARSERLHVVDYAGDGRQEFLVLGDETITCHDSLGRLRWTLGGYHNALVVDVRDYAGDGSAGILLTTSVAGRQDTFMLTAQTGKAVHLWRDENNFGGHMRYGKLLPDVRGAQIASTWSGENPPSPWSGSVRLVSFARGLDKPRFHIRKTVPGVFFSPLILFADMDADGRDEMVIISHEQIWTFDTQSGKQRFYARYAPMIRTYSAHVAAVKLTPGDPTPSLVMINPHIPGLRMVRQDGKTSATSGWKTLVGGFEDQYQVAVQIGPGGGDTVYDMANDGRLQLAASITNERGDRLVHLSIFDAATGARLAELADAYILSVEDLDSDGTPEVLLREGDALRIAHWTGSGFRELWRGDHATPLFEPAPAEGDRTRTEGYNPRIRRETRGASDFLVRFPDGVHACRLTAGEVRVGAAVVAEPPGDGGGAGHGGREQVSLSGHVLTTTLAGQEVYRYEPRMRPTYLAPPALVADLHGARQILVRHADGKLLRLAADGRPAGASIDGLFEKFQTHVDPSGAGPTVCDMDGDGENEIVATVAGADGIPYCAILDGSGALKRRIDLISGASLLNRGPTGRLGPGRGRWILFRMYYGEEPHQGRPPAVAAYDGRTGEMLWIRDHYALYGTTPVKFAAHIPTGVTDLDGDSADDWLVCSENFYGVVSVRDNRDLVAPVTLSDTIPGHWTAYTYPSLGDIAGKGKPVLLHNGAYSLALVTDLEGKPIWHYGMTRDTAGVWGIFADVDGDGRSEILHVQPDGVIRCFEPSPGKQKCPTCPRESPLTDVNHCGTQRWMKDIGLPVSRLVAADLDGDGRTELLFGGDDGKLHAMGERDGKPHLLWSIPFGRRVGEPILADVDSDGCTEILVPVDDGRLYCLKGKSRPSAS